MRLNEEQRKVVRELALELLTAANTGELSDETKALLTQRQVTNGASDEPAFLEPRPYFKTSDK